MRKRNPVVFIIVAFGVLLAVILVLGNARRAQQDPAVATTVATVASPTSVAGATTAVRTTVVRSTTSRPASAPTTAPITAPKGMASVRVSALPVEAQDTLSLIDAGGPFPYGQDGVVFQNREKLLPSKSSGYYHEYTVVTPGSSDRGTRRIIVGRDGERYYTDDHYASFRWVVP